MNREKPSDDRAPDPEGFACPSPLRDYPRVTMSHGGGGKLSSELIEHVFVPSFKNDHLADLRDSVVLAFGEQRLAFTTDSFVVRPLFFPGGTIGELAVHGTINDLAMSGAKPLFLSAGFIVEEGFAMDSLVEIAQRMGQAAQRAGTQIVTGDTKIVERGHGDGCYINTSGIGLVPDGLSIGPNRARVGDVVILSGTIGDHGMAIMSVREGLEFESEINSDTAPLHGLVAAMLAVCSEIRTLRDPTRGGVASALNEIAQSSVVGITIDENAVPVAPAVRSACEFLGLDPLFVANEGKLLSVVPAHQADSILAEMRRHPLGQHASIIGRVTEDHRRMVVARTGIGATRVITMQIGEQLPRIC